MNSINIFSQRNKKLLLAKKIEISIYFGIRESIYKLFLKYASNYNFENDIQMVKDELLIYQSRQKQISGRYVYDMDLKDFLLMDYPSSTLDAIEVFADITKNEEFVKDVNNIFHNNDLPFELVDGRIEIINQIQVPDLASIDAKKLKDDIDCNIVKKEYVLVLDRLHTYYGYFLKEICEKLGVVVPLESGHINLAKANKNIVEYLIDKKLISEFEGESIKRVNSLLEYYNSIRNDESYAHPNKIIDNDSAEFVVKIFSANMKLLEKCLQKI